MEGGGDMVLVGFMGIDQICKGGSMESGRVIEVVVQL